MASIFLENGGTGNKNGDKPIHTGRVNDAALIPNRRALAAL